MGVRGRHLALPMDEYRGLLAGIRFIQEDGSAASAQMPSNGMGIRRTVLVEALAMRAEEQGTVLRNRSSVLGFKATPSGAGCFYASCDLAHRSK
jgi:flavin-dependent dehydrogenase